MRLKGVLIALAAALVCGCSEDLAYHPAPQLLPANIKKVAIHMIGNKTDQMGLEDKLTLAIRDAFTTDGTYPIVPEDDADGVVFLTVQRYILTPLGNDATLIPTSYKLRIVCDLQFIDRAKNQVIWEQQNMEGTKTYAAATLPGGITEEQAREAIWTGLAADVLTRVVQGFGAYTGSSSRRISADAPSTEPGSKPETPITPVTNPY